MPQELSTPAPAVLPNKTLVGSPELPSRETLLGLLDSELTLLSQQRINNGWTSWAFAGAMGALAWMLLGQWEAGWPSGRLWPLSYMMVALCLSYTLLIVQMLQTKNSIPGSKTRFHLGGTGPDQSKAGLVFNMLQAVLFLGILFWCPTSLLTRIWVGVWLSLALSIWLILIIFSYTQFPFEVGSTTKTPTGFGLFLIHLFIIFLLVIPICLLGMDLLGSSPKALELKAGGLIAALHFLARNALDEGGRRPLIGNLLHIRRELALGGMSVQEAAKHTEIEFLGMRVSDVFQERARNFLSRADALLKRCKSCIGSLDAALASLGEGAKLSAQQQLDLINPVLEACNRQASDILASLTKLHAEYEKIESKTRRLSSSTDAREAVSGILLELLSRYNAAYASFAEIKAKLTQLDTTAKKTAIPPSPPSP
jgi:hypothetical protein